MRQIRFFASVMLMSGVILLGFQNCGQPGSLNIDSATSPGPLSNSLEVSLPHAAGTAPSDSTPAQASVVTEHEDRDFVVAKHEDDDKDDDKDDDGVNTINDERAEAICRDVKAADILLNVDRVLSSGVAFAISGDSSISGTKSSLHLKSSVNGTVKELNLMLKDEGNVLLGMNEMVYDLKFPGGHSIGLKVVLASPTKVEAGKKYELQLNVDLGHQIVRAGKKCIVKPVIHTAVLKEI